MATKNIDSFAIDLKQKKFSFDSTVSSISYKV